MRLIDAESLSSMRFTHEMHDSEGRLYVPFDEVAEAIFNALTIEAEPVKHGRWREYNYPGQECVYCSACKTEYYPDDLIVIGVNDYPYYCPNCGARMDLEGEDHEQD